MKIQLLLIAVLCMLTCVAQVPMNMICTNPAAEQIMLGNYNPADYLPSQVINNPHVIAASLTAALSADSLKSYLETLATFYNRNTYSDTNSTTIGIGATRRWINSKFGEFSAANENRLLSSYLQFDMDGTALCGAGQFRDIFAVLPGTDTSDKSIVIIEGHVDSRCEDNCSGTCMANGIEDNGTGTALVMELARVMSHFAFNRTIVFLVTVGEEQGLFGADAFARFAVNRGITIHEVQNNDVIGGVVCGKTASPPTDCAGEGQVDSSGVRIFSYGTYTMLHKSLARFIKLEYLEESMQFEPVPMNIHIMTPEDRTGRGGDHIPFRIQGFTASRLTAQHEHGNANVADTTYTDRQHTSRDILGIDTTGDASLDSFYVDFNYLRRNTLINATASAMAASGPLTPDFNLLNDSINGLTVQIASQQQYNHYRVSVRRIASNYDLDLLFEFSGTTNYVIPGIKKDSSYFVSVASMDTNNIESLFTAEKHAISLASSSGIGVNEINKNNLLIFAVNPSPSSEVTIITLKTDRKINGRTYIQLNNGVGNTIQKIPLDLGQGFAEITLNTHLETGMYFLSLFIEDKFIESRKLLIIQ
ncbi:hypothetical protein BH11BAC1_BH11BAC1_09870 [soil metagenome]